MNAFAQSVVMLGFSSMFMTVAWYAHLRFAHLPLWVVILASWAIAFFEYVLQVPGNRIGHTVMSAAQLRVIAEFFTLTAFVLFSTFYLKEPLNLNSIISLCLVMLAVYFALMGPFK